MSMRFFRQEYQSGVPFPTPESIDSSEKYGHFNSSNSSDPWTQNVFYLCLLQFFQQSLISSFRHSVMSSSLWPQGLQHTRLPCHSLPPGVCSSSCPSSQWCHSTISFSIARFSFCPLSFLALGSFLIVSSSGGQSIGTSASNEYSELISLRID